MFFLRLLDQSEGLDQMGMLKFEKKMQKNIPTRRGLSALAEEKAIKWEVFISCKSGEYCDALCLLIYPCDYLGVVIGLQRHQVSTVLCKERLCPYLRKRSVINLFDDDLSLSETLGEKAAVADIIQPTSLSSPIACLGKSNQIQF